MIVHKNVISIHYIIYASYAKHLLILFIHNDGVNKLSVSNTCDFVSHLRYSLQSLKRVN